MITGHFNAPLKLPGIVMSDHESIKTPSSKMRQWLINISLALVVIILMLVFGETIIRWVDGYDLSSIELNQNNTSLPQTE